MKPRIGEQQLRLLVMLGSPNELLLTPDRTALAMVSRGLCRMRDGAVCIAPAGLRALADALEAGLVDDALEAMRHDVEARKAKRRAYVRAPGVTAQELAA